MDVKVSIVSFQDAPAEVFELAKTKVFKIGKGENIEIVDQFPDVIFFATGGSEQNAIKLLHHKSKIFLVGTDEANSYASATEVKAYANQKGFDTKLVTYNEASKKNLFHLLHKALKVINEISGQTLGLIGTVSSWLVASDISRARLKEKLNIDLKQVSWDKMPFYQDMPINNHFMEHFNFPAIKSKLEDSSRVYESLRQGVEEFQLDAITVECFSIVQKHKVTACLALALFNDENRVAACEGDITSATGMMLGNAISGTVPWISNTVRIEQGNSLFAHCTVPLSLVKNTKIMTHYETNEGTAIKGDFISDEITMFRLNNSLSKAFVTDAKIINRPAHKEACRTQIEVDLPEKAIKALTDKPLGNHHLVLPGNHVDELKFLFELINIEVIEG